MSDTHYILRQEDQVGISTALKRASEKPDKKSLLGKAFIEGSLFAALLSCSPVPSLETGSQVSSIPTQSDIDALGLDLELIVTYEDDIHEPNFSVPLDILYNDENISLPHGSISFRGRNDDPPLSYAASFDTCPERLFLAHRADVEAAPASLTKVMTIYITGLAMSDENIDFNLNTQLEVPQIAIERARGLANFENLSAGDKYPLRMFLTGAGSRSDAISTVTLAVATGRALGWEGSDEQILDRFIQKMRLVAREIGMNDTGFVNATGDTGNYGSPKDFQSLIHTAYQDAPRTFRIAMGHSRINLPGMTPHTIHSSQFFRNNPSDTVIDKTGFLREAGYNETAIYRVNSANVSFSIFGADSKEHRTAIAAEIVSVAEDINPSEFCSRRDSDPMTIGEARRQNMQLALAN